MQHNGQLRAAHRAEAAVCGVSLFAAEVVAKLVARDGADEAGLREPLLHRFYEAVTAPDLWAFDQIKPDFKRAHLCLCHGRSLHSRSRAPAWPGLGR